MGKTMSPLLKTIIFAKLVVISAIFAHYVGGVRFGDKPIFGQSGTEVVDADTVTASSEPLTGTTSDEGYQLAETPKPSRKSYLDQLFDLPPADTNNLQKEEASKYINMVEKKRRQVEDRLNLLSAKEARLIEIERIIDDKLRRLDEEKRFLSDTLQKEKKTNEERTTQLVEFYKKMPPKAAAPVFEKMDKDLVVELFNKLPQKQITGILAAMNPETSVKLTEYYGRIRSGKEYELLKEVNKSLQDEFQNCKGM